MDALLGICRRQVFGFVSQQDGLAAAEYAIVLAIFVVAALGAMWLLGGSLTSTFSAIADNVPDAVPGGSHGPLTSTFEPVYYSGTHRPQP